MAARKAYQYETSPRKIQPNYNPKRRYNDDLRKKELEKKEQEEREKLEKEKNRKLAIKVGNKKMRKKAVIIIAMFLLLLAISYRNSLITEKFNQVQSKKSELLALQKTNGQLEVNLESSLNLNSIEKAAAETVGMQKLTNEQKVFVELPKKDYTEANTKEIKEEESLNFFEKIINNIFK